MPTSLDLDVLLKRIEMSERREMLAIGYPLSQLVRLEATYWRKFHVLRYFKVDHRKVFGLGGAAKSN